MFSSDERFFCLSVSLSLLHDLLLFILIFFFRRDFAFSVSRWWMRIYDDVFIRIFHSAFIFNVFSYIYLRQCDAIEVDFECRPCEKCLQTNLSFTVSLNLFSMTHTKKAHHIRLIKFWYGVPFSLINKIYRKDYRVMWHVNWSNIAFIFYKKRSCNKNHFEL